MTILRPINKYLIIILFLLCLAPAAQAQQKGRTQSVEVVWGPSVQVKSNFFSQVSGTGAASISLRYEYRPVSLFGVGLSFSYDKVSADGYTYDNLIVEGLPLISNGFSSRSQELMPIMATLRCYPAGSGLLQPYIGIAAGGVWASYHLEGDNIYMNSDYATWGWVLSPEIGLRVQPLPILFVDLQCQYRYTNVEWEFARVDGTHGIYPSIGVGLAF